jgi:hypothetical protein
MGIRNRAFSIDDWPQDQPIEELYEERIIAFIDVLGFREQISQSHKVPQEFARIFTLIDDLYTAAEELQKLASVTRRFFSIRMTTFSDNIVVSVEPTPHGMAMMLKIAQVFHETALASGFLMRGGITVGPIYHSSGPVFGPGFVRAYDLERLDAKYPRTIIDQPLIERFFKPKEDNRKRRALEIYKDSDGRWFVPYRLRSFPPEEVLGDLSGVNAQVRPKLEWFANWMANQDVARPFDEVRLVAVPRYQSIRRAVKYEMYTRRNQPRDDSSSGDDDIPF